MSNFTISFSGDVRKPQVKDIGGKPCVEFQLMRKNYAAQGAEATFTWIRVTVFDCKPWQITQCQDGKFVAGVGEFSLRSYEKDGQKRQSAEVRCNSFQIDGARTDDSAAPTGAIAHHAAKPYDSQANRAEPRTAALVDDPNSPPF